jgi:hypothetical protein
MSNQQVGDHCRPACDADRAGTEDFYDSVGDSLWPPVRSETCPPFSGGGLSGSQGDPRHQLATVGALDTYQIIYDGTDENGIVGTVAPGLFAQEGRCWRMVYENPVGHPTFCRQPVAWVGRWKF